MTKLNVYFLPHSYTKIHGNPFRSCYVILLANKQMDMVENITSLAEVNKILHLEGSSAFLKNNFCHVSSWCHTEMWFPSSPPGALWQTGGRPGKPERYHGDRWVSQRQRSLWCHREREGASGRGNQWETRAGDWQLQLREFYLLCQSIFYVLLMFTFAKEISFKYFPKHRRCYQISKFPQHIWLLRYYQDKYSLWGKSECNTQDRA